MSQNRIVDYTMNLLAALVAYRGKDDTVHLDLFVASEAKFTIIGKPSYYLCIS